MSVRERPSKRRRTLDGEARRCDHRSVRRHRDVAALAPVLTVVCLTVVGVGSSGSAAAVGAGSSPHVCTGATLFGVLPVWARAGFSSPKPRMAHVVGRDGEIAAILFGYPLASPPAARRNNKILWVSRRYPAQPTALWIRAQRMAGARTVGQPVTRLVQGGPGPSIINLPAAGCWRLRLAWAGRTDTLDLRYRKP
jgi:hypothetical protein